MPSDLKDMLWAFLVAGILFFGAFVGSIFVIWLGNTMLGGPR